MKWQSIDYNSKLEDKILSLSDGLLARYLRLTDLMIKIGSNLGMPHAPFIHKKISKNAKKRDQNS